VREGEGGLYFLSQSFEELLDFFFSRAQATSGVSHDNPSNIPYFFVYAFLNLINNCQGKLITLEQSISHKDSI
jgi:hypothetical protein